MLTRVCNANCVAKIVINNSFNCVKLVVRHAKRKRCTLLFSFASYDAFYTILSERCRLQIHNIHLDSVGLLPHLQETWLESGFCAAIAMSFRLIGDVKPSVTLHAQMCTVAVTVHCRWFRSCLLL